MLSKISRIKKLGLVFNDFTWNDAAPAFNEVNLIYGSNGCGKTTLTRLFDRVSRKSAGETEYDLRDVAGEAITHLNECPYPIRVFNNDYVLENVRTLDTTTNAIAVVLGAENQKLVSEIAEKEKYLNGDQQDATKPGAIFEQNAQSRKKARLEKEGDAAFTEVAKTIGAAIGGVALRNYKSTNAKNEFAKLTDPTELSPEELEKKVLVLKQEMLDEVPSFEVGTLEYDAKPHSVFEALKRLTIPALSTRAVAPSRRRSGRGLASWPGPA